MKPKHAALVAADTVTALTTMNGTLERLQRLTERYSRLVERLDALQAALAPGSEEDDSWRWPATGAAGLG